MKMWIILTKNTKFLSIIIHFEKRRGTMWTTIFEPENGGSMSAKKARKILLFDEEFF